uniref:Uncharacterized protein n=1 Tax=Anguilla anguilla TaxID=7936 RepID=A0A0E9S3D6_ANGAN
MDCSVCKVGVFAIEIHIVLSEFISNSSHFPLV